jgi:hypothetical protein
MLRDALTFVNGYKRIIVLAAYMLAAIFAALGHPDQSGIVGLIAAAIGWNDGGAMPVPLSVLAGTAAGLVAIGHAVKKELAAAREKRDTVSTKSLPQE